MRILAHVKFLSEVLALDMHSLWLQCTSRLQGELTAQIFSTWIRPLQASSHGKDLVLYAPNAYVLEWVQEKYHELIYDYMSELSQQNLGQIVYKIGSVSDEQIAVVAATQTVVSKSQPVSSSIQSDIQKKFTNQKTAAQKKNKSQVGKQNKLNAQDMPLTLVHSNLDPRLQFSNFVEGPSNQFGRASALQVAENPGTAYNPLFIYGGTGLGKTHLLHAVGNAIIEKDRSLKVHYLRAERFVQDMVSAMRNKKLDEFKNSYRSVDALLIDDIQFLVNKEHFQDEFFHTFNWLLEGKQQVILTCDVYPKDIKGIDDRLKSRFAWGLIAEIEPPDQPTRVAILQTKADEKGIKLPSEVAFFIAERLRSNVRELEGALNRIAANANLTGRPVTIDFVKESLRDLLMSYERLITLDNIQKVVANYYNIKISDLLSKRRTRSITRPRQLAMALSKELTNHSLPEIGEAFGGRDHTTVLHACNKVKELCEEDPDIEQDYKNLYRTLSV